MAEEQQHVLHFPLTINAGQLNMSEGPSSLLMRLESTSSMIKEEQQIYLDPNFLTNSNATLRTLFKSTSLLSKDMELSSDTLTEFFTSNDEFAFHRLLSDVNGNEIPLDMIDLAKFDTMKNLDNRSSTDFLPCDSFDQMNPSTTDNIVNATNQIECQTNDMKTTCSFTELQPPTPDFVNRELFQIDPNDFKLEIDSQSIFNETYPFDQLSYTPPSSTSVSTHFNFDPQTLMAYEHNYDSSSKSTMINNTPTPTPSPITSKRTTVRGPRRTSSRLQSRAQIINFQHLLNNDDDDDSCSSPTPSETISISNRRTKRCPSVSRAGDIKTEQDLSYYLERRRKNNEASKMSRAARKHKFDQMDFQCVEYERLNNELRLKLSTLEIVVASLKNGLIHNFRKDQSAKSL